MYSETGVQRDLMFKYASGVLQEMRVQSDRNFIYCIAYFQMITSDWLRAATTKFGPQRHVYSALSANHRLALAMRKLGTKRKFR